MKRFTELRSVLSLVAQLKRSPMTEQVYVTPTYEAAGVIKKARLQCLKTLKHCYLTKEGHGLKSKIRRTSILFRKGRSPPRWAQLKGFEVTR